MEIYRQIADSLDDFQILIHRMETIYEKFTKEDLKLPETATLAQVNDALSRGSFKGNITEGFNIFCLINQLAIALHDVKEKIKAFEATIIYKFFSKNTGNVEVQKDDEIMTIYFPIQPITHFLTVTTKDKFDETVNRTSNQHKILDLIARTPEFIDEMQHLEARSRDVIKITPSKLSFFRNFSTLLSIGISMIVIFFSFRRQSPSSAAHCSDGLGCHTGSDGYRQLLGFFADSNKHLDVFSSVHRSRMTERLSKLRSP